MEPIVDCRAKPAEAFRLIRRVCVRQGGVTSQMHLHGKVNTPRAPGISPDRLWVLNVKRPSCCEP